MTDAPEYCGPHTTQEALDETDRRLLDIIQTAFPLTPRPYADLGTLLGIPEEVFTPLFASARIAGWCANRIEEVVTCHRIMRPAYRAVTTHEKYIPMEERATHLRLADVE